MAAENSSDQRPVIQASEILAKIERGEDVKYDGVIVEGDLDISGLELQTVHVDITTEEEKRLGLSDELKEISSHITIKHSKIQGSVNFRYAHFKEGISFWRTKFVGEANFWGAKFDEGAEFSEVEFEGKINFVGVKFVDNVWFNNAKFAGKYASFVGTNFRWSATFGDAKFSGDANFENARFTGERSKFGFGGDFNFSRAEFDGHAFFRGAEFGGNKVDFRGSKFDEYAGFVSAKFTSEYISFRDAKFVKFADFTKSIFTGSSITFKNAKFKDPRVQEYTCRNAKRILELNGDRDEASHNFYLEMAAKRRQKPIYRRYPEKLIMQWIFGYGVYPLRIISTWIVTISIFAFIYWKWDMISGAMSPIDYIWFSIATAATPGYALYKPTGTYQLISGFEAILGTFLWAAFIATFARKWMR